MQFSIATLAIFLSAVMAAPYEADSAYEPCDSTLYKSSQCCSVDVLGVADLDCITPPAVPISPAQFSATCAASGKRARCCVLPVAGVSVLCQNPVGI